MMKLLAIERCYQTMPSKGVEFNSLANGRYLQSFQDEENAKAISVFPVAVSLSDAIDDEEKHIKNLARGIFVGNIFDMGSGQLAEVFSNHGMSFLASCQNPCIHDHRSLMSWTTFKQDESRSLGRRH